MSIIADLRFALLIVGHNLSFSSVDHITEISKIIFRDSLIQKKKLLKKEPNVLI